MLTSRAGTGIGGELGHGWEEAVRNLKITFRFWVTFANFVLTLNARLWAQGAFPWRELSLLWHKVEVVTRRAIEPSLVTAATEILSCIREPKYLCICWWAQSWSFFMARKQNVQKDLQQHLDPSISLIIKTEIGLGLSTGSFSRGDNSKCSFRENRKLKGNFQVGTHVATQQWLLTWSTWPHSASSWLSSEFCIFKARLSSGWGNGKL